jgi:hypothetical protein
MPVTRTIEVTNGTCRARALDAASKQRVMQMNDDSALPPADRRERGKLRAADSDRDQIAELLNVAFTEGRLSKDDYDSRLALAFSARTYADLDEIVTDLPVPPVPDDPRAAAAIPMARTNGLAVASLACGLAQFMFGPLATIPAIVFGHLARHQIKRTGEQGAGLALAGLILGWAAVILAVLLILGVAAVAGMHGMHGMMR